MKWKASVNFEKNIPELSHCQSTASEVSVPRFRPDYYHVLWAVLAALPKKTIQKQSSKHETRG